MKGGITTCAADEICHHLNIVTQLDEVAPAGASQNYDLYRCVVDFVHSLLKLFSVL